MNTNTIFNFLSALALGLLASCSNSDVDQPNCTAEMLPETLRFRVMNQAEGSDLFFSEDADLQPEQLAVYSKNAIGNLRELDVSVSDEGDGDHFLSRINLNFLGNDTVFFRIADMPYDTVSFIVVDARQLCPRYAMDRLVFNGNDDRVDTVENIVQFYR